MDSEARSTRRPLLARILLGLLGLILVLVLLALGAAAWLLGTESGARVLVPRLLERTEGAVAVHGLHGPLIGPLRIERIVVERTNERIELTDVRLDWRARALLDRTLHVRALYVARMVVTSRIEQTPEPATGPPESLALPLALRIEDVRVDQGELRRGPAPLASFGPLALGLNYANEQYLLDLRRFGASPELEGASANAGLRGRLDLSARQPFPLSGRFSFDSKARIDERTMGAEGTLVLDGTLQELLTKLELNINGAPLAGRAVLHPFSDQLLGSAELRGHAIDLRALDPALPRTALELTLDADAEGAGTLRVQNQAPASLDQQGLPLQQLTLRFRQQPGALEFEDLRVRLGSASGAARSAGEVVGKGRYANGALTLALHTDKLDLQRIDGRMRSTRLSGSVDARHADGRQEFTLALTEPFGRQRIALDAHAILADAAIEIRRAELQAGAGRLRAEGMVALEGSQAFRARGEVSRFRLHDFGRFAQVPEMNLNGSFSLEGARAPQLEGDLQFDIADSRLGGQPLSGAGRVRLRGERIEVPQLSLASGANRLSLQGQLDDGDAELKFTLQAPRLGQLGPSFSGALFAEGSASGSLQHPAINASWQAQDARLPGDLRIGSMQGHADLQFDREAALMLRGGEAALEASGLQRGDQRVARLDARLRFAPQPGAPLAFDLDAKGIDAGGAAIESAVVNVDGTTARHTLQARITEKGQQWAARLAGGLAGLDVPADPRWEGRLEGLEASGRINARSSTSAPLLLSREQVRIEDLQLAVEGGQIRLDRFERNADGFASRGQVLRLQVAPLLALLGGERPLQTDLVLGGEWDLRYDEALNGRLALRRESGDLTVLGTAPVTLGLSALRAEAEARDGRIRLDAEAAGQRMGRIRLDAATRLGDGDNGLALAPNAALEGRARIDIPSLAWLAPLVNPVIAADGRLAGDITLGGTISTPAISGRIDGDALRVAHAELGLDLRQGTLRSEFDGDRLLLQGLNFEGPQGRLRVSGPVELGDAPAARLLLEADRFAVLNRPDRRLVLSGDSRITWQKERAMVTGAFTVNSGYFDIGQADRPTLSDDVVIVGQQNGEQRGLAAAIDVTVGFGDGVTVQGRGLDARVGGQLRVLSDAGEAPQAEGRLRVLKGTFSAYGRELAIEQGELRFAGPLNNPALDILAMRRGQEVEAGVSVRGTVLAPRITLVSEPVVPDAEKLAWLVIGRSLANAGAGELGSLQAAAAALLAQGAAAGVQSRIASAFGLDTFSVGTSDDTLQQRIVTIGKQLSSRLYVGYQHGLESAASVVQLRYLLTPRLSVEAEAGARSALSLFYNIAFD